jgi:transcriptional antiterminator RfaH
MLLSTSRARWYVVHCKPRQDGRALENLVRQGFSCFLPTVSVEKVRGGCKLEVQESLFPGYLFIQLDEVNDNWQPIRSTRGVSEIVHVNEYPVPVHEEVIGRIRDRLASNPPRVPNLLPGERVVITEGCFSELEAIFVANDGEKRIVLLMNILQREQTLSFPVASVRKCSA